MRFILVGIRENRAKLTGESRKSIEKSRQDEAHNQHSFALIKQVISPLWSTFRWFNLCETLTIRKITKIKLTRNKLALQYHTCKKGVRNYVYLPSWSVEAEVKALGLTPLEVNAATDRLYIWNFLRSTKTLIKWGVVIVTTDEALVESTKVMW